MNTVQLVTLIVSIYNSQTRVESSYTQRMTAQRCEREVSAAAKAVGPGDVLIAQCVRDSKFLGGK